MKNKKVILSGHHITLTDEIKQMVEEKLDKLFRHEEQIIRIVVELSYDQHKSKAGEYVAKGHIEINGPDMIVSVASEDITKSMDQLVDKLDRKIRRRGRLDRVKRKAIHNVDIPAHLPKVAEA